MAEQISRRANNVTSAGFDQPFETHIVRFGAGGLNLKDSLDAMEGWSRMTNIWHEAENEVTARPGQDPIATHTGDCHSVRLLRSASTSDTRFWGVADQILRGHHGALAVADAGPYSGDPVALVPHRPTLSGDSWMFIGDRARMRKISPTGLSVPIGLPAPTTPATTALASEHRGIIAMCSDTEPDGTGAAAWVPQAGVDGEGTPVNTPDAAVGTEGPINTVTGSAIFLRVDPGAPVKGYDAWWGCPAVRDLTQLHEVSGDVVVGGGTTTPANDNDICSILLKTSHPAFMAEIRVYVVISPLFDPSILPGTDDTTGINTDAYVKAFRPNDFTPFVQAQSAQVQAAEQARIYALRDADSKARGYNDARASWEDARAGSDPGRARSFQLGTGAHQWFSYGTIGSAFRRGDFQRIGNTVGCDWATVTGLIIYVRTTEDCEIPIGIGVDDWYLTGGFGPDTVEPGAQQYDYRVTHYDPRTGAESNGSTEQPFTAYLDSLRRHISVTPPAYGDAAVRQRIYRRGGSIVNDWFYCGSNTSDGGVFVDELSDAAIVAAPGLPVDHYQPVPTVDANGNTVLAQPLPALWGPIEGMLLGCGDPYRPGHVYFSNPDAPDHWSALGNVEVCAPSEQLMNGCLLGHQAFVWSRTRGYFLYPQLSGDATFTATPSLCTRGLLGRWAFCVGPGGVAYFVAEDGIFATNGGPEEWLSEAINPLFYGVGVNGYAPINKTAPTLLRLTVWENALYFLYQAEGGERHVLVYSILQKFWRHYSFGQLPWTVQGEDEDVLVIGGTNQSYLLQGTSDGGVAIACRLRTGSASGGRREEKLFGDLFLDADLGSIPEVELQVFLNEETTANLTEHVFGTLAQRQRFLVKAFGDNPQKAHSIACELRWSTTGPPPTLYQLGYAITLQPDVTATRVTNWDDLNSPDEVWLSGVTLDVDTGGADKQFHVERDFNGERTNVATFTVNSANRHKFKFSWAAVPAHMVRIRPDEIGCATWILYRADWIYVQEPPRISHWDIHFEAQWDQYYTGLDLYCDTGGLTKQIQVWVDEVMLPNTLQGLPYWPITTTGRQVVHLTLPWGRGHVFRFVAIDDNPGLLYTHRWHLDPEPSEQANWNQNFSILGTRADKWLKALVLECDTYGQDKLVQVEVDGAVVETLTVNTTGRKVVQLALTQQFLGRVWRIFPVDANPGRLYSAEPLFDEEPFALTRWETQETNHGLPGWFYPLYAHVTLKSTADVTLRTVIQHNQVGGTTTHDYVIPATGGQKQRRFVPGFQAGKGVLIKYLLTSAAPFWLYRDETTVVIQPWGAPRAVTVQPFGNDDLDPTRPMTHAVLAAAASGGVPQGGAAGGPA
jgi:hypothetical protein